MAWWLGAFVIVGLVIVNAGLVGVLIFKRADSAGNELSFSFKGGYGKGKYGADRGLKILDQ